VYTCLTAHPLPFDIDGEEEEARYEKCRIQCHPKIGPQAEETGGEESLPFSSRDNFLTDLIIDGPLAFTQELLEVISESLIEKMFHKELWPRSSW